MQRATWHPAPATHGDVTAAAAQLLQILQ